MTPRRTQHPDASRTLLAGVLLTLWAVGCTEPSATAPDAARKDAVAEAGDAGEDVEVADVSPDRADATAPDAVDARADAPMDAPVDLVYIDLGPFVPDDVPAAYDVNLDRNWDVPRPDVNLYFMDVSALFPDVAPPDTPFPLCTVGAIEACACPDGRAGFQTCEYNFSYSLCACADPPPAIPTPRLVAPLSGMRVTSQRPTLRWQLPAGVTRARVELCADRPCTRRLAQQEVTGSSWRSPTRLTPGLTFWRVRGLDAAGAAVWTSATWLFQVRRRDTEVDSILGRILDFNGDGYDDLVMPRKLGPTLASGNAIDVFFGTPDGLTPEPLWSVQSSEEDLARSLNTLYASGGDANGDGYTDLAAMLYSPSLSTVPRLIYIYQGNRSWPLGRRTARMQLPNEEGAFACYFPDLDGDGISDVLADGRAVFRGSSSGPSSTPEYIAGYGASRFPGNQYWWVHGADANQDGFPDAFQFADRGRFDQIAYGTGSLDFNRGARDLPLAPIDYRESVQGISIGDFNGDGHSDLVRIKGGRVNPGDQDLSILSIYGGARQPARDTPRRLPLAPGHDGEAYPTGRAGDINGDGFADVVVTFLDSTDRAHRVALYLGSATGLSRIPDFILGDFRVLPTAWQSFNASLLGDFNGDGFDDIVVSESESESRHNVLIFDGGERRSASPDRVFIRGMPLSEDWIRPLY